MKPGLIIAAMLCWAVLAAMGCKPAQQERKYRAVSGTASYIDLDSGRVSMDWKNQKTGNVRTLSGRVTQNTEILINGISAGLESVRLGDRATVVVYPDPSRENNWIVTSVAIEREELFVPEQPVPAGTSFGRP